MFFTKRDDPPNGRGKPVRTGVWLDGSEGSLTLVERDGTRYEIKPVAGRWRLSCGSAGSLAHERGYESWESTAREGCLEMADFMRRSARLHSAWCDRKVEAIERPSHLPGILLKAFKKGGNVHAEAIDAATGRQVGHFRAAYTGWRGTWVIGEETVNTSSFVSKELVGTGLGKSLYDLVEEVAGLPLVPHGLNHVGGGRTEDSRRFWDKRARHVRVPGFGDPAVEARNAAMDVIYDMLSAEVRHTVPEDMIALASRTGLPVEVLVVDGDLGPRPVCAWCIAPDGRAVTARGAEDRDAVAALAASRCGPGEPDLVRTDAAGLSVMIGAYMGRLCLEPPVPHVPTELDVRMAETIARRHRLDELTARNPGPASRGEPLDADEPDGDGEEIPVERRALSVIAAVESFAAGRPITVFLRPYRNPYTDAVQGVVLTDLFAESPGNGVGSAVVRELLRLADAADISVYTDAEGPRSAGFYAKMGFERSAGRGHQFAHHPPLPAHFIEDEHATLPAFR